MNDRYSLLGIDTALSRYESAHLNKRSVYQVRLRALEFASSALNLAPEAVHLAAELAALEPDLGDDDRIALIVLILVSLAALDEGSTRYPVTSALSREPMQRVLGSLCSAGFDGSVEATAGAIEALLQSGRANSVVGRSRDEYKPLLYIEPYIAHQNIYWRERTLASRLATLLTNRARSNSDTQVARAIQEVVTRPVIVQGRAIVMSEEQRDAIAGSARAGLTVVSGGPGTGKTSIVVAILRLMVRLGVDPAQIALAAPTGKAAFRMGECLKESLMQIEGRDSVDQSLLDGCPEPSTIHRLLGYSPQSGRFYHHSNNRLSAKVVIVDEGSMLDVTLMERLASAIQPDARLVILGDANQLPSVAAGSVFRDLVAGSEAGSDALAAASIELRVNHRMRTESAAGRSILFAANSINEGSSNLLNSVDGKGAAIATRRSAASELRFEGVESVSRGARELRLFLDHWYNRRIVGNAEIKRLIAHTYVERDGAFDEQDCGRMRRLFEHVAGSRILCVTRVFETGSERINARLHARAAESAGLGPERTQFVVGEPLIVLRNDYERGLFNGDNGIGLWVSRDNDRQVPMAVFPRGNNFVAFRFEALSEFVELSYAMTVHKAQGSEFDSVAIILPETPVAALTRELIYTAVSRSRSSVAFVGDESILAGAIATRAERFSGLGDSIRQALADRA